ncbi:transcription termination/antitermination protein NusA [Candidatus Berkelbacteria bacterium]|nr:transcription termination/antitermination protein NusA [Candidatus Berkelbacteria bacterium]
MAISPFIAAINQICDEKSLAKDTVIQTIEAALAAAYRREYGKPHQLMRAELHEESGDFDVWREWEVVKPTKEEPIENPEAQLTLEEAKKINPKAKLGEMVEQSLPRKSDFGRIAAQTAKQVIIQRIREAEREIIYAEFKTKEDQLVSGVVQQIEGSTVIVNLGKTNGVMPASEQIPHEHYYNGQRLRFHLKSVEETPRGPRLLLSRSDPGLVKALFTVEVPEILAGSVEIKGIVREAGSRSKVAVTAHQEGLDPIGSCVGQRGTRIQAVLTEIGEEKIDIVLWDEDEERFIANALSPAKIEKVKISKKKGMAKVIVPDDQLSLAIGKGGQNVRLAGKLVGYELDIEKISGGKGEKPRKNAEEPKPEEAPKEEAKPESPEEMSSKLDIDEKPATVETDAQSK